MAVQSIATSIAPNQSAGMRSIDRQRQMAQLLQNQALKPTENGRMISGHYVPTSYAQHGAKLAQLLAGQYRADQADEKQVALEEKQRQAGITDYKAFADAVRGTPEVAAIPEENVIPPSGEMGNPDNPYQPASGQYKAGVAGQDAVPGMPQGQAAMQYLMNSQNKGAAQAGAGIFAKSLETPEPYTLAKDAQRRDANNNIVADNTRPAASYSLAPQGQRFGPNNELIAENTNETGGGVTVNLPEQEKAYHKKLGALNAIRVDDWVINGRSAVVANDLKNLDFAIGVLEANPKATGPIAGLQPDWMRAFTNPKAIAARDAVHQVIQKSLKPILGAQFGEKEGDRLIARGYNESLKPEENLRRIRMLATQTRLMSEANDAAAAYIQANNGSLDGFTGKLVTSADFDKAFNKMEKEYENGKKKKANSGTRNTVTDGGEEKLRRLREIANRYPQ